MHFESEVVAEVLRIWGHVIAKTRMTYPQAAPSDRDTTYSGLGTSEHEKLHPEC